MNIVQVSFDLFKVAEFLYCNDIDSRSSHFVVQQNVWTEINNYLTQSNCKVWSKTSFPQGTNEFVLDLSDTSQYSKITSGVGPSVIEYVKSLEQTYFISLLQKLMKTNKHTQSPLYSKLDMIIQLNKAPIVVKPPVSPVAKIPTIYPITAPIVRPAFTANGLLPAVAQAIFPIIPQCIHKKPKKPVKRVGPSCILLMYSGKNKGKPCGGKSPDNCPVCKTHRKSKNGGRLYRDLSRKTNNILVLYDHDGQTISADHSLILEQTDQFVYRVVGKRNKIGFFRSDVTVISPLAANFATGNKMILADNVKIDDKSPKRSTAKAKTSPVTILTLPGIYNVIKNIAFGGLIYKLKQVSQAKTGDQLVIYLTMLKQC